MYDKERIGTLIGDLERYFKDLEGLKINKLNQLEDKKNFYSVSMLLFSIMNRVIDLGEEIVASNNLGVPATYKDIFHFLWKGKIINKHMKDELSALSSYRNAFSHDYHNFSENDVFEALLKISIVTIFLKKIKKTIN